MIRMIGNYLRHVLVPVHGRTVGHVLYNVFERPFMWRLIMWSLLKGAQVVRVILDAASDVFGFSEGVQL